MKIPIELSSSTNKTLTFTGENNNVILNGINKTLILKLYSGNNITLNNLTFVNSNGSFGGAIFSDANLLIENCTFDSIMHIWCSD